jgi:hypothetical protein
MVVATTVTKNVYSGDGSNKSFPFTFRVGAASDIALFSTVVATGVTTEISSSDFSLVVNGNRVGGTVTYPLGPAAAVASTVKITVARAHPYVQPVQVENQTRFFPSVLADGLDNLAMQIQQVNEEVSRKVGINISETSAVTYEDILAQRLAADEAAVASDVSSVLSQAWAESPTAPGAPGTKSSKTWAGEAVQAAEDASTSLAAINAKITVSVDDPSGGSEGDLWLKYTPI